ncbi:MAG: hypothetical protein RL113_259 [Pseudomonadota bacterium]|jgi:hypothetical protein
MFDDDDFGIDFWGRSPQSSYFEIAKTANQNIVEHELEKVFRRLAVAEKMLEDRGLAEEHKMQINATMVDEDMDGRTASIFIDLVGAIVTQCE